MADALPTFKYHPDPIASGSVEPSDAKCQCCKKARGYIYTGPVYAEDELDNALCPWCIADGSANEKFEAEFVDSEAFDEDVPAEAMEEITQRTPGFATWQSEHWPACCDDATAFLMPVGIEEIRNVNYEWEGLIMPHIVHNMGISGGAATRLLASLNRDKGPTAYVFKCLKCGKHHFHIDQP